MTTPSERNVQTLLKQYKLSPNKLLGQHFLLESSIIEQMISAVDQTSIATLVEIGPGLGVMTDELIKTGKRVIAIEKDRGLASVLQKKCEANDAVTIVNEDILKCNPKEFLKGAGEYSIIANLPYSITARFLKLFLADVTTKPNEIIVMIQQEVAQRLVAKPGNLSKIGILAQVYSDPAVIIADIPPTFFYPQPKVTSAAVLLKIKEHKTIVFPQNEKQFWQLVRIGFSAKRKKLSNNLAAGLRLPSDDIRKMLTLADIPDSFRAEDVPIAAWVKLVDIYAKIHCR